MKYLSEDPSVGFIPDPPGWQVKALVNNGWKIISFHPFSTHQQIKENYQKLY